MTDNVIWGTDFKAKAANVDISSESFEEMVSHNLFLRLIANVDTTPSEYTAPDGDCA